MGEKLDHKVKSKKKTCVHSRGHSFDPKFISFVRMLISIISKSSLKLGHVASKTRSLGQNLRKILCSL